MHWPTVILVTACGVANASTGFHNQGCWKDVSQECRQQPSQPLATDMNWDVRSGATMIPKYVTMGVTPPSITAS